MIHYPWAYTENESQKCQENRSEYEKIKHLRTKEHMEYTGQSCYAHNKFRGKLISDEAKQLTNDQILLIMDSGNLCFGGEISRSGDNFSGRYNTD